MRSDLPLSLACAVPLAGLGWVATAPCAATAPVVAVLLICAALFAVLRASLQPLST